ncbi:MAG: nuclear transport factor 2 family protein [Flavobacterium sp.]|nr:nuclear transport factor 2 family protein [Flavobacterium sp.]
MRTRILIGGLAVIVSMMSCEKKETVTVDKDQVKAEIQALEDAYASAMNNRDALGAAAYYAEDAKSFPNEEKPLVGEKAIVEAMERDIVAIPEDHKITYTTNEVIVSREGDQVLEIGDYILTDRNDKKVRSGNFFSVFEKRDGKYVCIRDISTPDSPRITE